MTALRAERFDIGRVIERTFGVLGRNLAPFYILSLLLTGLPAVVFGTLGLGRNAALARDFDFTGALLGVVGGGIGMIAAFVLQGALVFGTVNDLNGRRAPISDILRRGLVVFLPLLGIAIVFGIAITFGFLLLFVPGLIMLTVWAVVVPVEAVERKGVFGSFDRSAALTRGARWSVFGLLVLYVIVAALIQLALGAVIGALFFGGIGPAARLGATGPLAYIGVILSALASAFINMIGAVGTASLYYELRSIKEGISPDALASVFD